MWTGTQFMTEQIDGSDVSNLKWKRVSRTVNGVFAATVVLLSTDSSIILILARSGDGVGQ